VRRNVPELSAFLDRRLVLPPHHHDRGVQEPLVLARVVDVRVQDPADVVHAHAGARELVLE
jgi:hypothetical protein